MPGIRGHFVVETWPSSFWRWLTRLGWTNGRLTPFHCATGLVAGCRVDYAQHRRSSLHDAAIRAVDAAWKKSICVGQLCVSGSYLFKGACGRPMCEPPRTASWVSATGSIRRSGLKEAVTSSASPSSIMQGRVGDHDGRGRRRQLRHLGQSARPARSAGRDVTVREAGRVRASNGILRASGFFTRITDRFMAGTRSLESASARLPSRFVDAGMYLETPAHFRDPDSTCRTTPRM